MKVLGKMQIFYFWEAHFRQFSDFSKIPFTYLLASSKLFFGLDYV